MNYVVAPHAGAWIEIFKSLLVRCWFEKSPLTQGRGLKYLQMKPHVCLSKSPLTQGRGLK